MKNEDEYEKAIANMAQHLKPTGTALFVGTRGTSRSEVIPEYCYQGVQNTPDLLQRVLSTSFDQVEIQEVTLKKDESALFPYNSLLLCKALHKKT